MTITTAPRRPIFPTVITVAASVFLAAPDGAHAASAAQSGREESKKMTKTASGLEYRDLKVGTGQSPKTGQTCVVHYTGWLWQDNAKGKKFDSSLDRGAERGDRRGTPFGFHVGEGEVIKGWDEGISTMKVGGKRELRIPPIWLGAIAAPAALSPPTRPCSTKSSCLGNLRGPRADSNTWTIKRAKGRPPRTAKPAWFITRAGSGKTAPRVKSSTARWTRANPFHSKWGRAR